VGKQIGVVTSSTLSPMLGGAAIAFGMIRTAAAVNGARVLVAAEGQMVEAVIGPLRMWNGN
jgi:glycine cleavage system aminomethyltransferase T